MATNVLSLTIIGFKSFGKETTLTFNKPITAIVGPNGSGKSNVVEAFRYVLGEQSQKSLRSNSSSLLLFQSPNSSILSANYAKVEIVFDNTDRKMILTTEDGELVLQSDMVTISRELFRDGKSVYRINSDEVRLKDVHHMLMRVGIGTSSHHIISQGEADRVLSATSKERKHMVEEALGLRHFEITLRDATRKCEKAKEQLLLSQSSQRELSPEIAHLGRQVKKIEEAKTLRETLGETIWQYEQYNTYFFEQKKAELLLKEEEIQKQLEELKKKIQENSQLLQEQAIISDSKEYLALSERVQEILLLIQKKEQEKARNEATIAFIIRQSQRKEKEMVTTFVLDKQVVSTVSQSITNIGKSLTETEKEISIVEAKEIGNNLCNLSKTLYKPEQEQKEPQKYVISQEDLELQEEAQNVIIAIEKEIEIQRVALREVKALCDKEKATQELLRSSRYERESELLKLREYYSKLSFSLNSLSLEQERNQDQEREIREELERYWGTIGKQIQEQKEQQNNQESTKNNNWEHYNARESKRSIERSVYILEDAGALGGNDVLVSYQTMKEKQVFLEKEILDTRATIETLERTMKENEDSIRIKFDAGIEIMNEAFHKYVSHIFGGGGAILRKVELQETGTQNEEDDTLETKAKKWGIEVEVQLPKKKITNLGMLSGGEKSLISIALLCAFASVTPPPCMILDETDAALDEANSKRYAALLKELSAKTQLFVVTHNRETMLQSDVLYGVTLRAQGSSQVLSLSLDDAARYSK
jgi:chromosome segregation ATPase